MGVGFDGCNYLTLKIRNKMVILLDLFYILMFYSKRQALRLLAPAALIPPWKSQPSGVKMASELKLITGVVWRFSWVDFELRFF